MINVTPTQILAHCLHLPEEDIIRAMGLKNPYTSYTMEKGNKKRPITVPEPLLKQVQLAILWKLLPMVAVHPTATGFRKGTSITWNAQLHGDNTRAKLSVDIEGAFSAITTARVTACLGTLRTYFVRSLGVTASEAQEAVSLIAQLCTCKGVLPQGAPTSPSLFNICCWNLDCALTKIAQQHKLAYSRYADDITVSGEQLTLQVGGEVMQIVKKHGFTLRAEKTHWAPIGYTRSVRITGISLKPDGSIGLTKSTVDRYRAILHAASLPEASGEQKQQAQGIISFVAMVYGSTPPERLKELITQLT